MKAEELRIGNWVESILSDKQFKIEGISKADKSFGDYYLEYNNGSKIILIDFEEDAYVRGIPLTPEILEKCGFEAYYSAETKRLMGYRINGDDLLHKGMELLWFGTKIEFLHQLQNAYYVIYGTDLKVNLTWT